MANIAIGAGLLAGAAVVAVVLLVAARTNAFTAQGTMTLALGALLIGMSVWGRVRIGPDGFEFEQLEEDVQAIATAASAVTEQVEGLALDVSATRDQVATVTRVLRRSENVGGAALGPVQDSLAAPPRINLDALRAAQGEFDRASTRLRTDLRPSQ